MLKVYIAASLATKANCQNLAEALGSAGFEVTSSWITIETGYDRGKIELEGAAMMDKADLERSEVVVHAFTGVKSTGGGADAELGMAIALGKPVLLLGQRTNIFHWMLEDDRVCGGVSQLIKALHEVGAAVRGA